LLKRPPSLTAVPNVATRRGLGLGQRAQQEEVKLMTVYARYAFLLLALLASALIAGFFYAYSVSVMPGLAATDPLAAAHAMRGINAVIRKPVFAFSFFGALAFPLVGAFFARRRAVVLLALAGALVYGLGAFAVTFAVNVPLNDALGTATLTAENAAALWRDYARPWNLWNHVRALASIVAFALLMAAVVLEYQR
jgi:uncharacterized membrane protein